MKRFRSYANLEKQIGGVEDKERWKTYTEDFLQPQFYPDPVLFKNSLQKLTRDDIELMRNLASNKTTIRVLAPYLKTMRKKIIQSSVKPRPETKKDGKVLFDKKVTEIDTGVAPNLWENVETIISIQETADVLKSLVEVKSIVPYLVDSIRNELHQSPRHTESSAASLTWKIEKGTTMAAHAAFFKEYVVSNNIPADERFPLGLGFPNSMTKYGLCVPIKTPSPSNKVVAVYELTRDPFDVAFEKKDIQLVLAVAGWMGAAILQNSLYSKLARQQELTGYLIQLTSNYHAGNATFNKTLTDLLVFARDAVGAESCNLFTVEKRSENSVTLDEHIQSTENSRFLHRRRTKRRIVNDGSRLCQVMLRSQVVSRSQALNTDHDLEPGERSILCVPILSNNEPIGAIQLKNKKLTEEFDESDSETLQLFASFCGISLTHLQFQEKLKKSEMNNKVVQEMLFHHIKPCVHDEEEIKHCSPQLPEQFFTFAWYPSLDDMPKLVELTINMFHEILGNSFMTLNNVPKFILTVKNCYRTNSYHNYLHAFGVAHAMANIISRYRKVFTGLERKGLMIAALCHDVDHRGYNNNFLQLTQHHLSKLYDVSPLENHHFAVTKMLIQQCGMFGYLKPNILNDLLTEIYENIIATDLVLYFQFRIEFMKVADEKAFTFHNHEHRRLVKSLMMTACDLSGQTKPFAICQKITEDVYEEFYQQGDVEKKMGFVPLPTMDRDKKDMVPENQVQFLSVVVLPCVETVSRIFNTLSPMVWDARFLVKQWQDMVEVKDQDTWKPDESF